jgi:hypothetical protein
MRMMKRVWLSVVMFMIFYAAAEFAQTRAAGNFLGTWKLVPERSSYSPGFPPKSLVNTIEAVDAGLKVISDGIDAKGKATHFEWTAKFDGKDYPVKSDPSRDAVSIKQFDDYTLELTNKKAGKVVNVVHAVYAKDGKSRTETRTGTDAEGLLQQLGAAAKGIGAELRFDLIHRVAQFFFLIR